MNTAADPFRIVRAYLGGGDREAGIVLEPPPFQRLIEALDEHNATPLDLAVLARHALRYEEARSGVSPLVYVPLGTAWPTLDEWQLVGVTAHQRDAGLVISAAPWLPDWLPDAPPNGVDGAAAGETERVSPFPPPAADPFVRSFHYDHYRSEGQRSVLRSALTAPAGSTLVVSLPTGEGKSLVFHALARFGFGDGTPGVTVVVTPTVALALDHESSARLVGFGNEPMAYRAGDSDTNAVIADRIRKGEQPLCFASPEALCGSILRSALEAASRAGLVRAIVVDEAHLIDSWGISFRPDFQVLAGLRRQLLSLSKAGSAFRTVLLSATLTGDTIDTLRGLFPPDEGSSLGLVAAARLRPEIDYWVADDDGDRQARVMEALLHLPRPAILYTTERWQANDWYRRLRNRGFRRIGMVTGETPALERQRVVDDWRAGRIDLAVGTSAFGLGIDNPHVRAVVHACVPETLDRFYQEVGRGGRDGHSSISLILPTRRDRNIAKSLSRERLISSEKGAPRWRSMFLSSLREPMGDGVFRLPVDVRPGVDATHIDMVGPKNTGWNVRTLVLLAAMGAITLEDADVTAFERAEASIDTREAEAEAGAGLAVDAHAFARVRVVDTRHLQDEFWARDVEEYRATRDTRAGESLRNLTRFLDGKQCVADLLAPLYAIPARGGLPTVNVARSCGGCPACRRLQREPYTGTPEVSPYPWKAHAPAELAELVRDGHLVVCLGVEEPDAFERGRHLRALARLVRAGVRNVVVLAPGALFSPEDLEDGASARCFVSDRLVPRDLPPGPTLIMGGPGTRLDPTWLAPRSLDDARIWLLPHGVRHPSRPDLALCDLPPGGYLTLAEFSGRLSR